MRLIAAIAAAALLVLATAGDAAAYPEFQFSTGNSRCTDCHFSPAGGGLINDYGRFEAGSTISDGGDGSLLHGAWDPPSWLHLGGDVRVAALGKRVRGGIEEAIFPMQADLYARVEAGGLSLNATGGLLGQIRHPDSLGDRIGSREHYLMYQTGSTYVRAGRFFPVFGLRLPDHTAYVRRYTGLHTFEEIYGVGGGWSGDAWEVHATITTPLTLHPEVRPRGWGAAIYTERFVSEMNGLVALHGRAEEVDGRAVGWLGLSYKRWFEGASLLLAAEGEAGLTEIRDAEYLNQLTGYAALHYRPASPVQWQLALHYHDPDARLGGQERGAIDARFSWFPKAHFEVSLLTRLEHIMNTGNVGLALLQLHYYL